jgi:hypothetical protein
MNVIKCEKDFLSTKRGGVFAEKSAESRKGRMVKQSVSTNSEATTASSCVNIGSGYSGIADSFARYATLLAYWRCGEQFLNQVEAEDVQVPRDNITGLQRICTLQIGPQVLLWSNRQVNRFIKSCSLRSMRQKKCPGHCSLYFYRKPREPGESMLSRTALRLLELLEYRI